VVTVWGAVWLQVLDYIILQMVEKLRESFRSGKTREKSFRIKQLKNLLRMLDEKEDEITEAGYRDLRKVNRILAQLRYSILL